MNKKFIKVAFVAAIAMVSGVNVFNAQKVKALSEIALANVEALAQGEIGTGGYTKSTGNCSGPIYYKKWVSCKSGGTEECSPSDC